MGRVENTQKRDFQLMDVLEQVGAEYDREHSRSRSNSSRKLCRANDYLIFRVYVNKVVEKMVQEAIQKLYDRVISIVEQTGVDALETFDVDCYKASIKGVLRSALNELLIFILDGSLVVKESF